MTIQPESQPKPVLPLTVEAARQRLDKVFREWGSGLDYELARNAFERAVAAAALGDKQQALPAVVDNSFLEWVYADLPISERDKLTIRNRIFRALTEPAVVDDKEHKDGG